jgi:hypothetical protein
MHAETSIADTRFTGILSRQLRGIALFKAVI